MVVIAAVDRSDRAKHVISEANTLAEAFDEPLHVVNVLNEKSFVRLEQSAVNETGEAMPIDEIKELASELAEQAGEELDVDYKPIGLMGSPALEVLNYAKEANARYLVVGGRKRSPAGKVLFGSVTQSILLNAPCPVLSVIWE